MSSDDHDDLVFKALADRKRRRLLDLVKDEPKTTSQLCQEFSELDRCTVMQHIGVLENAGLIVVKREGRRRWNYINSVPIRGLYDRWINKYASPALERLTKLSRDLE